MIANSLFHFTKYLKSLKLILESKSFRASYNFENIEGLFSGKKYLLVPMVCFCDIPLKFIDVHSRRYGSYGLGLSKNWGRKNQINPILYRAIKNIDNAYLEIGNSLTLLNNDLVSKLNPVKDITTLNALDSIQNNNLKLSFFMKGEMEGTKSNYIDREWRFLPDSTKHYFESTNSDDIRIEINDNYFSSGADFLNFEYSDIKYIIIPRSLRRKSVIKFIQRLSISEDDKYLLIQKLVDLESIKRDY